MTRVPLSRQYLSTPWPVTAFNVMSKPGGPRCNMTCQYCYYDHHQSPPSPPVPPSLPPVSPVSSCSLPVLNSCDSNATNGHSPPPKIGCAAPSLSPHPSPSSLITDDLLQEFIRQYIQSQDNPTVFFTWQGGEPTLAGLDFYRRVIQLQQQYDRPGGPKIANAFQTNGMLLDDQWCRFFAEHRFHVGLSIDGPADIHNAYRRTRSGGETFDAVRRAAKLLQQHGIRFDTLTTVTPMNVHRVEEVYEFLTRELGSTTLQFQPCVERKDFETVAPGYWPAETLLPVGDPRTMPDHPDSILTEWSISAQQWGRFLCQLFDLWWQRDRETVVINWIHSWASQFAGGTAMMCICSPICGRALSMERDGRLFSCDHFVFPEYQLGQLGSGPSLSDLVRSERQKAFGEAKSKTLPRYCRQCPFVFACFGECPKRRFLKTPDGEPGLNYLCPAFRTFFAHAGSRLAEFGQRFTRPRVQPEASSRK